MVRRWYLIILWILVISTYLNAYLNAKVFVSPSYSELLINKDRTKKYVTYYTIGNTGDKEVKIYITLNNGPYNFKISSSKTQSNEFAKKLSDKLSISEWLKLEGTNKFALAPKEKKRLTFYITPPEEDYSEISAYLSFTVDKGSMIKSGITVPLYVIINENAEPYMEIKNFELITNRSGDSYSINKIKIKLKNDSNVHLRPKAKLIIKERTDNKIIKEIDLGVLAPTFERGDIFYLENVDIKLDKGKYIAKLEMKYFFYRKETEKAIKFEIDRKGRYIFNRE